MTRRFDGKLGDAAVAEAWDAAFDGRNKTRKRAEAKVR